MSGYSLLEKREKDQPRCERWGFHLGVCVRCGCLPLPDLRYVFLDNHGHAGSHRAFLVLGLAGTALSCVCTGFVLWSGIGRGPAKGNELLRRSAVFSNCLLLVEVLLGGTFIGLLWTGQSKSCGFVEWVMAFLFTFYLWAFIGLLAYDSAWACTLEGRWLTIVKPCRMRNGAMLARRLLFYADRSVLGGWAWD